jgi:hypothetical protein
MIGTTCQAFARLAEVVEFRITPTSETERQRTISNRHTSIIVT